MEENKEIVLSDEDKDKILREFAQNMIDNTIDLEPEIVKLVNENFWDLV